MQNGDYHQGPILLIHEMQADSSEHHLSQSIRWGTRPLKNIPRMSEPGVFDRRLRGTELLKKHPTFTGATSCEKLVEDWRVYYLIKNDTPRCARFRHCLYSNFPVEGLNIAPRQCHLNRYVPRYCANVTANV